MFHLDPKKRLPDLLRAPQPFLTVPEFLIVGTERPVTRLSLMFQSKVEFLLDAIVNAITDRVAVHTRLFALNSRLSPLMHDLPVFGHYSHLDKMVTIEQSALDLLDYFTVQKMYLYGRYLPYQFETLMQSGALLLRRLQDYDQFYEQIIRVLGHNEIEENIPYPLPSTRY